MFRPPHTQIRDSGMNSKFLGLLAMALIAGPMAAHAALTAVDGGFGVYDSNNNVTWLSDANLFATQAAASGNSAAFVNTIIADSGGVVTDLPNAFDSPMQYSGSYTLSASDFITSGQFAGQMTFWGSVAWVHYLNVIDYGGSNKWALPTTIDANSSVGQPDGATDNPPQSSSQLAQLFFGGLGEVVGSPITTSHNGSYSLFSNVQDYAYRSGTEVAYFNNGNVNSTWFLNVAVGDQNNDGTKNSSYFALAVAPGEVNVMAPEIDPTSATSAMTLLFGALAVLRARKHE